MKKFFIIFSKLFLSVLAFFVAVLAADIFSNMVLKLSPDPKTLSLTLVPALIFPIWIKGKISARLLATFIGSIAGIAFWCISLVLPIEEGGNLVFLAGAIRACAFIIAIGIQWLIIRGISGQNEMQN